MESKLLTYLKAAFDLKWAARKNAPLIDFTSDFKSHPENYILEVTFEDNELVGKLRRKNTVHNDVTINPTRKE